jgi:hypothetical protein
MEHILSDLGFSEEQIDVVGKVLSLEGDKELVRFVEMSRYEDLLDSVHGEIMLLEKKSRTLHMTAVLQNSWYDKPNEVVFERVKTALIQRDIDISDLYSFSRYSYAIDALHGIDIHIGGTPIRDDKKYHLRDAVIVN